MIKTALIAVFGAALVVPTFAQDNFPDAPENHWAYQALENLKREGILVGYPDGTYKGSRDLTRYELAVALNAAYQRLKMLDDGLADQIAELRKMIEGMGGSDTKPIMDRLSALEAQMKGMSGLRDDVAAMKKMADEFQKELASMGVDVEEMKKNIADIMKNMGGTSVGPVSISGDVNLLITTGCASDGTSGVVGIDGRVYGQDENGNMVRWHNALGVYHELAVKLSGGGNGVPNWRGTVVYGNLIGESDGIATQGLGNQAGGFAGTAWAEGPGDVYVQELSADIDNGVAGMAFKATLGRQGWQSHNAYIFRRSDNTPFYANDRWDNGNWYFDGVTLNMNFGAAKVTVLGGRNSTRQSTNGVEMWPIGGGALKNTLGAEVSFSAGETADISLAYLLHSENGSAALPGAADRLDVYGGDIKLNVMKDIGLSAGYSKSVLKNGTSSINDNDNQAYWAKASWKSDKWGVWGGYRKIEQNYFAAGDWDRIGTNWAPTNIENFMAGANFSVSDNISLMLDAEFGEINQTVGAFTAGDNIMSGRAALKYGFNEYWNATLGYEDVKIELGAGDIRQKWATVGFGYNMGKNSMLNIVYQYGDVNSPAGISWGGVGAGRFKGSILNTNLSIKF